MTIQLLHCHLADQCRPIGSGWRWLFVEQGRKWVKVLDPWNRYTVRVQATQRDGQGWDSIVALGGYSPKAEPIAIRAKRRLKAIIESQNAEPSQFELRVLNGESNV